MRKHIVTLAVAAIALMIAFIMGACSGKDVEEAQTAPLRNGLGIVIEGVEWDVCVIYGWAARAYVEAAKTLDFASKSPSEFTWGAAARALSDLSNKLDFAASRIGERATDAAASALAKGDLYFARIATINAITGAYRDLASDTLDRIERGWHEMEVSDAWLNKLFADVAHDFRTRADEARSAVKRAIASDYCEGY